MTDILDGNAIRDGYASSARDYERRGWIPVPIPLGRKAPPPAGYTGHGRLTPSGADIEAWSEDRGGDNIAIVMPDGVVGIDVDAYGDKPGATTIAKAIADWGALPPGPRSTSRPDDPVSGIRFFRVPLDWTAPGVLKGNGGVEIIQPHHRYAVACPSTHPEGRPYVWLDGAGQPCEIPNVAELPELPPDWVKGLYQKPVAVGEGFELPEVGETLTDGAPDGAVTERLAQALGGLSEGSRHDHTRDHVLALMRYGKDGSPGVWLALKQLGHEYVEAVWPDRASKAEARSEYLRMIRSPGARRLLAEPSHREQVQELDAQSGIALAAAAVAPSPAEGGSWGAVDGAAFILDQPKNVPAVWGDGKSVLWPEGEGFMIAGGQGLGKTTLAGLLLRGLLGLEETVLGLPVNGSGELILYLAMDRPRQIARSLARQFTEAERALLAARVLIRPGPPVADLAQRPEILAKMAEDLGAGIIFVDSIKDAAVGLSNDEVGAGYNRARQHVLNAGRQICDLHHVTKTSADGINDIYGSTWLTSGCGGVVLLTGSPGDPIVGFRHVKPAMDEVGPYRLAHDAARGRVDIDSEVDLVELATESLPDGLTAKGAARALNGTDTVPTRGEIEKARRRLDALATEGRLVCMAATEGPAGRGKAAAWFPL
jgi:hypothetical protein